MAKDGGTWEKSFFDRAIQSSIGRALRTHYDVPEELPDDLSDLLKQIDKKNDSDPPADDGEKKGAAARVSH
jgi:hypothetical protein